MSSPAPGDHWLVLKFGGTSVSRRERWDTIAALATGRLQAPGSRVLVVVSALGGVTNELAAIADGAIDAPSRLEALVGRHRAFADELGIAADPALASRIRALGALLSDARVPARPLDWQAEVLAQGELLSSTLGVAYLASQGMDIGWCDARDWLQAAVLPNQSAWAARLSVNCSQPYDAGVRARFDAQPARLLVTQGFIARHGDGGTAILGRGGSDTSAACFGALLGAGRVEIWT
ncbi:MAG TPA: bifunctional aspartate kinase/diaminopimelate decarboxylase, partial [Luteimonas sp.]|nr:bifunctional aspartate kinase/diaminopimelate decarboxylase [Luteimonas sp.]